MLDCQAFDSSEMLVKYSFETPYFEHYGLSNYQITPQLSMNHSVNRLL